jgi:hypothetical protein
MSRETSPATEFLDAQRSASRGSSRSETTLGRRTSGNPHRNRHFCAGGKVIEKAKKRRRRCLPNHYRHPLHQATESATATPPSTGSTSTGSVATRLPPATIPRAYATIHADRHARGLTRAPREGNRAVIRRACRKRTKCLPVIVDDQVETLVTCVKRLVTCEVIVSDDAAHLHTCAHHFTRTRRSWSMTRQEWTIVRREFFLSTRHTGLTRKHLTITR